MNNKITTKIKVDVILKDETIWLTREECVRIV